jgi:hypothetical protein
MSKVFLHIDRLVLKGFRNEDRHAIAEGLHQELTRLLADPQAVQQLTTNGDVSHLRAASIQIDRGSTPQRVGLQVAQGVGKEMKK